MSHIKDFFHFISAWNMWHALFHGFVWLDWILFLTCLVSVGLGIAKGFGFFFGGLIRFLILIFTVMLLAMPAADWAADHLTFAGVGFWDPVLFFTVTFLVLLAFRKFSSFQSKGGPAQFHPILDKVLGAAAGFFFALLLVSFISQFVLMLPIKVLHQPFKKNESRYGLILRDFAPQLVEGALAPVRATVNRKVSRSL